MVEIYPDRVDEADRPEPTPDVVPDEIVERAVEMCSEYRACPKCGHEQWMAKTPGNNVYWNCNECDAKMTVVG